eukprot:scaffold11097_cov116-Isochrysis_galbana.AAC.5
MSRYHICISTCRCRGWSKAYTTCVSKKRAVPANRCAHVPTRRDRVVRVSSMPDRSRRDLNVEFISVISEAELAWHCASCSSNEPRGGPGFGGAGIGCRDAAGGRRHGFGGAGAGGAGAGANTACLALNDERGAT